MKVIEARVSGEELEKNNLKIKSLQTKVKELQEYRSDTELFLKELEKHIKFQEGVSLVQGDYNIVTYKDTMGSHIQVVKR